MINSDPFYQNLASNYNTWNCNLSHCKVIFLWEVVPLWKIGAMPNTSFCRKEAISEELCMFESHSMSNLEPIITEHYLCSVEKNDIDTQVYINLAIVISKQKLSLSASSHSQQQLYTVALKCGSRDAKVAKKNTNTYLLPIMEDNILDWCRYLFDVRISSWNWYTTTNNALKLFYLPVTYI